MFGGADLGQALLAVPGEPGPEPAQGWLAVSVNRTVPCPALAAPATGHGAHHGVSAFVWPAHGVEAGWKDSPRRGAGYQIFI